MSSNRDQILIGFYQECEDLLESLQEGLGLIESRTHNDETINSIFRSVHSIKGGAGAFGLVLLVKFSHGFETLLDEIRNKNVEVSDTIVSLLWRSSDMLTDLVDAARTERDFDDRAIDKLLGEHNTVLPKCDTPVSTAELEFTPVGMSGIFNLDPFEPKTVKHYKILFNPDSVFYKNGNETSFFLRGLAALGQLEVTCDQSLLPDFDEFDPDISYLAWDILLTTVEEETAIREVFEFAEGFCDLEITLLDGPVETEQSQKHPDVINISDVPTVEKVTTPEITVASPINEHANKPNGPTATVRVDVDRVDRLINLVGELVVAQSILSQCVDEMGLATTSPLVVSIDGLEQLSREIQESVMTVRAQPIKPLFQRMSRIVRESSAATGKSVKLEIIGEMTEIDKMVIEKLADPLTHMLRNAIDHGLETTAERVAAGKPETGVVTLTAAHRSGRVLIEVADDGGGIDRERVKQIAISKGIVFADTKMTPEDIDAILFMPGFSTAEEVTKLSGRGVGLDVVKKAIQSLGGQVSISSQPGVGSKFSISLPLTLAVLDGMIVEVAGQRFVIPITAIVEAIHPGAEAIHQMDNNNCVVSVRGEYVRVVDIGRILALRSEACKFDSSILVVVETSGGAKCAMAFDAIQDLRQVVIKSLEKNYQKVLGVAAATILGDGKIALILDPNDPIYGSGLTDEQLDICVSKIG